MEQRGESSEHVSDQLHDPVRDQVTDRETNGDRPAVIGGAPRLAAVAESARRAVGDVRHWGEPIESGCSGVLPEPPSC